MLSHAVAIMFGGLSQARLSQAVAKLVGRLQRNKALAQSCGHAVHVASARNCTVCYSATLHGLKALTVRLCNCRVLGSWGRCINRATPY